MPPVSDVRAVTRCFCILTFLPTGNWAPGYSEEEQGHPLLSANNVSEHSSPGKAQTVLSLRAIGDIDNEDNGIGIKAVRAIKKLDDMLVTTIVEDARRVREKDEDLAPIADMPKNLSKVFEEENDGEEYEKFHRRIKGDRLSMILKKPKSFDWVSTRIALYQALLCN